MAKYENIDCEKGLLSICDPCPCGEKDFVKLRVYRTSDGEKIGRYCETCDKEWVKDSEKASVQNTTGPVSFHENTPLLEKKPMRPSVNTAFQVQSGRTRIDTKYFAEILKPGDHVAWHRIFGYWHHSIVCEIHAEKSTIDVIHWTKKKLVTKIVKETISMNEDEKCISDQMYRIDYPEKVTRANGTELVLARARSRIGNTGYGLFTDNCESFATYCKAGCAKSHQVSWLKRKVVESFNIATIAPPATTIGRVTIRGIRIAAVEVIPGEVTELANSELVWIGALFVIAIELLFICYDVYKAYANRKDSKISWKDFKEAATRRVVEGIFFAGSVIGLSIYFEQLLSGAIAGHTGKIVGGLIGGILGGILGGAIGIIIGTLAGSLVGKIFISRFPDDRAVMQSSDLKPGDHIILKGWLLHLRCHAIVLEVKEHIADEDEKIDDGDQILVIRNTSERGVVEEWTQFEQPLFRVEYKRGTCLDPEKVIENAKSKLSQTNYNLATYNCKTFARECKTISKSVFFKRRNFTIA